MACHCVVFARVWLVCTVYVLYCIITVSYCYTRILTLQAEYRNELFYPPYFYDFSNKPAIVSINGIRDGSQIIQVGYGEILTVEYGSDMLGGIGDIPVTSASIVAPSATTHSFNSNQRVVFLRVAGCNPDKGILQLATPPNPFIAPLQMYKLFLMNGKTYGNAWWVQLVDKEGVAKKGMA